MSYIEPKDLMIDDYVQRDDRGVGKVFCTSAVSVSVLMQNGTIETWSHDIEPIPITTYRLEKNGFLRYKPNRYAARFVLPLKINETPQTIIEFTFYLDKIDADTLLKCWAKPQSCDGENNIHICDIKYIHELQHNLRNLGLKDVANNFKI